MTLRAGNTAANTECFIVTVRAGNIAANTGCFIMTVSTAALPKLNPTSAETSHDSDRAHKHDNKKRAVDDDCFPFHRNLTTNTTSTQKAG